jgi:hypothetical protein
MAAQKDPRGRKPSLSPKKHVISGRLTDTEYAVFCEMRQEEAAALRSKGIDLTESDFLRALVFEAAERRRKTMEPPIAAPSSPESSKPRRNGTPAPPKKASGSRASP